MDELKTTLQEVIETREKIGYVKGIKDCLEVMKEYIEVTRYNHHNTYLQVNGATDSILKVIREGYESELTEAQQNHISETALDGYDGFDFVLSAATGDFERLERQLKCFLKGVIE